MIEVTSAHVGTHAKLENRVDSLAILRHKRTLNEKPTTADISPLYRAVATFRYRVLATALKTTSLPPRAPGVVPFGHSAQQKQKDGQTKEKMEKKKEGSE